MVDFKLTDEQKQYQQLARDFAQKEIVPQAHHYDEIDQFPADILKKAWEIGLMNGQIPEQYGGLALGALESCLIAEEIGAGCTGFGAVLESNSLSQAPVVVAGNVEQKKEFLEPFANEFLLSAFCVGEPMLGSDFSGVKTLCKRVGDDYVVNGQKNWITNGGVANWYYVLANTTPEDGTDGLVSLLMPAHLDGIEIKDKDMNLGRRASDMRSIVFHDVKVPSRYVLGQEGDGLRITMTALDRIRPLISSSAIGLARSAMEHSIKYAKERSTFGQPIANHQAVGFMIADMAKDIEAARLMTWQAAWLIDNGHCSRLESQIAKTFSSDIAMRVAIDAVQIFGGYGYSREYPVEKLMRDAKMFQIYEGTSPSERISIGRQLIEVN